MRTKVYEIPDKITTEWDSEGKAIIDTMISYHLTLEEFKVAVMVKGVNYAKANGGRAWIVDSSNAKGTFVPEVQKYIEAELFPKFTEIGIKYFLTVNATNPITRLTVNGFTSKLKQFEIKLLRGGSVDGAIEWLKRLDRLNI